jgi:hypothetical protein
MRLSTVSDPGRLIGLDDEKLENIQREQSAVYLERQFAKAKFRENVGSYRHLVRHSRLKFALDCLSNLHG